MILRTSNTPRTMKGYSNEVLTLISMAGSTLAEGESHRDLPCPFCNGGQSNEKAFVVTKKGLNVLFICHRASCGKGGTIDSSGSLVRDSEGTGTAPAAPESRPYTGVLEDLLPWHAQMLFNSFRLGKEDLERAGIRWARDANRLALPVRSRSGVLRGYMLRGINNWGLKWEARQELTNAPWMAWYPQEGMPLVLVEDQYSALKASRQYPCAALLGTNLNVAKVLEILEAKPSKIVLALDGDAYAKALSQREQWKFYFDAGNFGVANLSKDLKYLSDEQIKQTIEDALP